MSSLDRLVVGIDFGTTYSGVAFAYSGKAESADEIQPIKSWPGANNINSDKVPSELAYGKAQVIKPASTSLTQQSPSRSVSRRPASAMWNFDNLSVSLSEAGRTTSSASDGVRWGFQLSPNEVRLRCMKLFLDPQQDIPAYISKTDMNDQLRRSKKTAETAVTDYLTELFKHARTALNRRFGQYFVSTTKIEVVLTVPAVWSDAAKDATLRAAKAAGTAAGAGMVEHLTMISEPEAAAVYTLQAIQPNVLREGDNFIVCDAGGGTVDLVSYEIQGLSPLRITESAEGTGKCCGAAFLNIRFEQYVRSKFGDATFSNICEKYPRGWLEALKNFEEYVKRNYNPDEEREFNIPFPGPPDMPAAGLEQGYLIMSSAAVGGLFKPIVQEIVGLVEQQMTVLKAAGREVTGIVLVGGFGQSDCLFKALQARFEDGAALPPAYSARPSSNPSRPGLQVMQPSNAWTAVVRGAVLRGLEGAELVTSRKARNHYGITHRTRYDPAVHQYHSKVWCHLDEMWMADKVMMWYIKKGQTVSSSEPVLFSFYWDFEPGDKRFCTARLIVCSDDTAPKQFDPNSNSRTRTLCKLGVSLESVPRRFWEVQKNSVGDTFERLNCEVGMQIKSGSIVFDLRVDGVVYGDVSAKFE